MPTLLATAKRIANEVARPWATSVDRDARFPHEAFAALREERLLAAVIPARARWSGLFRGGNFGNLCYSGTSLLVNVSDFCDAADPAHQHRAARRRGTVF